MLPHSNRLPGKPLLSLRAAALVVAYGSNLLTGCGSGAGTASSLPLSRSPLAIAGAPATRYGTTILSDRPIAFYRMNDTTTLLHDSALVPKHGSYGSAATLGVASITSTNETAAAFPGGDYSITRVAQVAPNAKFQTPAASVEAWVDAQALNSSNRYQPIVAYGSFSSGTPYQLAITPINQFFFSVHTATGTASIVARTSSSPGRIFHIVGAYDGTALKLYVNGVLEGQLAVSGAISYTGVQSDTGLAIGSGLNALAAHPIDSQLVTQGTESAAQLVGYPALVPASMEAYEGPNEPDLGGHPNWIANTRAFMQLLYTAVKGNAATAALPVMGPSVVGPAAVAALGTLSNVLDYGNIHPYYGPNNPGNAGTGSITPFGRSGSVRSYMNVGAQISGAKPMVASETGFSTGNVGKGNVSELCDGKEAPRTYFVHFKNGITRTLAYQFVESGTAYGALGAFSFMGFVRQNLTPKPSYGAIKALIGLLSDAGGAFTTASLTYVIRGNVNNLEHLLLQKRNGTYYLALWLEVPSWNEIPNADITAPLQSITVTVPSSVTSGSLYSLNDFGGMSQTSPVFKAGTVTLQISDRISVLAFHR